MKTPLQEFIEQLEKNKHLESDWEDFKMKSLEKEKKHIMKAVNANEKYCVEYCNRIYNIIGNTKEKLCSVDKKAGLNYYTKTYNI